MSLSKLSSTNQQNKESAYFLHTLPFTFERQEEECIVEILGSEKAHGILGYRYPFAAELDSPPKDSFGKPIRMIVRPVSFSYFDPTMKSKAVLRFAKVLRKMSSAHHLFLWCPIHDKKFMYWKGALELGLMKKSEAQSTFMANCVLKFEQSDKVFISLS